MTLPIDPPLTMVIYKAAPAPRVPPVRAGKCQGCGATANPPTPGAGTWEVIHTAICPVWQAIKVWAGIQMLSKQVSA